LNNYKKSAQMAKAILMQLKSANTVHGCKSHHVTNHMQVRRSGVRADPLMLSSRSAIDAQLLSRTHDAASHRSHCNACCHLYSAMLLVLVVCEQILSCSELGRRSMHRSSPSNPPCRIASIPLPCNACCHLYSAMLLLLVASATSSGIC
jgi:hypothetical protein